MKRNEKKVPGFDEIVFENRNREYGAFLLRKYYKSVTSFSILAATTITTIILVMLFLKTEPTTASDDGTITIIAKIDNYIPQAIKQPELKLPDQAVKTPQNVVPVVVSYTSEVTGILLTVDQLIETIPDGNVLDTNYVVKENPLEIIPVETKPFIWVEEMPEFPGGESALLAYIAKNIKYPAVPLENNIQGRVFLKFVVNPDGSVGTVELLKGVDPQLDREAARVIGSLPGFKPGKQGGVPVPVWYSVPVLFRIENL
jgi:protein TonB